MKSFPTAISPALRSGPPSKPRSVTALFPLLADLRGRAVLVVGGGRAAESATASLLQAGAVPLVGAPELTPALRGWAQSGQVRWLVGSFDPQWLALPDQPVWLTIAASDVPAVNAALRSVAGAQRLLTHEAAPAAAALPPIASEPPPPASRLTLTPGSVALVGAGPGDPACSPAMRCARCGRPR